jgi:DNA-binding transcriptional LysR family regulator
VDLKPSQLRVFLAVAETGNIVDAARRIGRSPSAVSMTLKQIREIVGGDLFESDRKDVLTDLGTYLTTTARAQLTSHDRAMASVHAFAKGEIGRVALACVPSVAIQLLPEVIRAFTTRWPEVELELRDIDTASVVRAIERGTVEFGIASRPASRSVDFSPLFNDRLVYIYPEMNDHEVVVGAAPWARLRTEHFIANGITAGSSVPEIREISANAAIMVRNTTSIMSLVGAGVGTTILPELSIPIGAKGIRLAPLEHGPHLREVGVIQKSGLILSPAAVRFLEFLRNFVHARVDSDGNWFGEPFQEA